MRSKVLTNNYNENGSGMCHYRSRGKKKKKGFKKYKNKINTFNLDIKCFEAIP